MTSGSLTTSLTLIDAAEEARARSESIITWLLEEERVRGARSTLFLDSFARRLIDAGLPPLIERLGVDSDEAVALRARRVEIDAMQ